MNTKKHRNHARMFKGINIGDKALFKVTITKKMHAIFAKLFEDFSPIHCNDKFASGTKFNKKIGYAFMLTGFLSKLYGEYLPGGSSICIRQEVKFIKPFFINDTITVIGEVINKSESTQFIDIGVTMYRNKNERILKGEGTVQALF